MWESIWNLRNVESPRKLKPLFFIRVCFRDVHLGLYTVSLILQVITHGHRGASSTTRQQWVSLWRYCLGEHTQVTWGGGQGSNDFMESQGLCMAIGYSMPKGM